MKKFLIILNVFVMGILTKYLLGITAFIFPAFGNKVSQELIAIGDRLDENKYFWSDVLKITTLNVAYIEVLFFTIHGIWQWATVAT